MKLPLVLRSYHDAKTALWKKRFEEVERSAQAARQKSAKIAANLTKVTEDHARSKKQVEQLVQLCEERLRDIRLLRENMNELRAYRSAFLDQQCDARIASAPYRGPAVPVIVGIDVEPDHRVVDLADPSWRRTSLLFAKLPAFRERLRVAAGDAPVHFTWFLRADHQVEIANGRASWALEHFADHWRTLSASGDETWLIACLRSAIATFRQHFGKPPACYRGGDRFLSAAVVRQLEKEGVRVDLTLERMPEVTRLDETERSTGVIPDGSRVPVQAFRPSNTDHCMPDPGKKSGLGMIPLTAHQDRTLKPWLPTPDFETALDQLLEKPEQLTHLAFVVRSDISEAQQWDDFIENTVALARRVKEGRLVFMTASEAWDKISTQGALAAR